MCEVIFACSFLRKQSSMTRQTGVLDWLQTSTLVWHYSGITFTIKDVFRHRLKHFFFLLSNLGWNFPPTFWNLNETTKTSKFCLLDYRSSMRLHDLFMMMGALFDLLKSSWKLQLKYMPIKLSLLSLFSLKVLYHFDQSKFTNLWITNLTIWTSAPRLGFEIFQVGFFQAQSALSGNDYTQQ